MNFSTIVLIFGLLLMAFTLYRIRIDCKIRRQKHLRRLFLENRASLLSQECLRLGSQVMSDILACWTTKEDYSVQLDKMLDIVEATVKP